MKKTMKTKIVLALLMSGAVCMSGIYGAQAQDITINGNDEYKNVNLTGDGNTVTISGVTQVDDTIIAGSGSNNNTKITDSKFKLVYGAVGDKVSGNTVEVSGTEAEIGYNSKNSKDEHYSIIGGQASATGEASRNEVIIRNGIFSGTVVGGMAEQGKDADTKTGSAVGNKVIVYGGTVSSGISSSTSTAVQGGVANAGEAKNNEVHIYGGTIQNHIVGGESQIGNVIGNKVVIGDANDTYGTNHAIEIERQIYGGKVVRNDDSIIEVEGAAMDNSVEIHGGIIKKSVTGGWAAEGDVAYNKVIVDGGTTADLSGGKTNDGNARYNKVIVRGDAEVGVLKGGDSQMGVVSYNEVLLEGNATAMRSVSGGYSQQGIVRDNVVNIKGGTVDNSSMCIYGGQGYNSNSIQNSQAFERNVVNIYDGMVNVREIFGAQNYKGIVKENKVNIMGGTVSGKVYAAWSYKATENNEIMLSGDADVSNAALYGMNNSIIGTHKDNILRINGWTGQAKEIHYFDSVEFSDLQWNTSEAALTTTKATFFDENKGGTDVKVTSFAAGQTFREGESMILIHSNDAILGDMTNDGEILSDNIIATAGVAQEVTMEYEKTEHDVNLKITDVKAQDQTKIITGGSNGGMALLNQGMDLASNLHWGNTYGTEVFAVSSGSKSRYDTNNDLKLYGWTEVLGIGNRSKHKSGDFAWAIFYEHGNGDYVTQTHMFGTAVRGDGNIKYNGGGMMGRYDWNNGNYAEVSFHAGTISDELKNGLMDNAGTLYSYETDSSYWSAHVGLGHIFTQDDKDTLDVYAKYFYSRIGDDSFMIGSDKFEVDEVTSSRLRAGVRFNDYKTDKSTWYYGAAYDYEFDGESTGKAQGLDIRSSSLKGGTVIGEAGYVYNPNEKWTIDSALFGFAGQRDGFGGQVNITYHF